MNGHIKNQVSHQQQGRALSPRFSGLAWLALFLVGAGCGGADLTTNGCFEWCSVMIECGGNGGDAEICAQHCTATLETFSAGCQDAQITLSHCLGPLECSEYAAANTNPPADEAPCQDELANALNDCTDDLQQ